MPLRRLHTSSSLRTNADYLATCHVSAFVRAAKCLACVSVVSVLVACGGSDSGGTAGGVLDSGQSTSNGSPVNDGGAASAGGTDSATSGTTAGDTAGTSAGGSDSVAGSIDAGQPPQTGPVSVPTPATIQLQTNEELAIDGEFELLPGIDGLTFPDQIFTVIAPPAHGNVIQTGSAPQFTYAPEQDFFGEDSFVYAIETGATARVIIDVININDPPVIFDDLQRVVEQGSIYAEIVDADDPDRDPLNFQATNLPAWLELDAATGVLNGTPAQVDVGIFENIAFRVTDPDGLFSEVQGIRIEVIDINDAPTINTDQFPETLDAGESISINLYPDDPDGDLVSVTVEQNDFLTASVTGSTLTIVAGELSDVTTVNLVIVATDLRGRVRREIVPLVLHPISSSGRGRTLRGRSGGEGIHLVVLGDGYRQDQLSQFRSHVEELIEIMQKDPGMETHFAAWNVHMVETASVDSGIDDNVAVDNRDTVFNSGYFCREIQRLICADQLEMYDVAITEYPNFDQIVMLVNDVRYGGSGGNVAISSIGSLEIALHEMGHSIAGLADEYVDRYQPDSMLPEYEEGRYANVSRSSDPATVPWSHWILDRGLLDVSDVETGVGIFTGAYYRAEGYYRPTFDSLMRSYEGELGPVNSEQWALSVYSMANPVLDLSPATRSVNLRSREEATFSVLPLFEPSIQSVEWRLDDQLIAHSGGRRSQVKLRLLPGSYELALKVRDVSGLIRKPEPHLGVFTWSWSLEVR